MRLPLCGSSRGRWAPYLWSLAVTAAALAPVLAGAYSSTELEAAKPRGLSRLQSTVSRLASVAVRGRDNGTPGSTLAQRALIARLRTIGPGVGSPSAGDEAYRQRFSHRGQSGTNLLAIIPGSDIPDEFVLIGAHYDHLDRRSNAAGRCRSRGAQGREICNGATDNATGVAEVIEIGRAIRRLPRPPRRSVILALWDAEEDGLIGSNYYVQNPVVPLERLVGTVNLDIQGTELLPSLRAFTFAVGAETGGDRLKNLVSLSTMEGLRVLQVSHIFGQGRSDYVNFTDAGIPTVFFSDSTGPCYHTIGDDVSIVDFQKLSRQSVSAFRTVVELAETETPPVFVPVPSLPGAITFEDARNVQEIVRVGMADLFRFSEADQANLLRADQRLTSFIADGPTSFVGHEAEVGLLAVDLIDSLARIPCRNPRSRP